jgi:hypothetical protein
MHSASQQTTVMIVRIEDVPLGQKVFERPGLNADARFRIQWLANPSGNVDLSPPRWPTINSAG